MNRFFTAVSHIADKFGYETRMNPQNMWPLEIYNGRSHLFSLNKVGGIVLENGFYNNQKAREMLTKIYDLKDSMQSDSEMSESDGFSMTL